VLDLSTGLRDDGEYAAWGTDRDDRSAGGLDRRGRPRLGQHVRLQARKALAQVGGYRGDAGQAAAELRTWVDIPLDRGAQAVDVWTWRQPYRGGTAMLLDSGLRSNALWRGLARPPGRPIEARHPLHAELDRARAIAGPRPVARSSHRVRRGWDGVSTVHSTATDRRNDGGIPPSAARRALDVLAATALLMLLLRRSMAVAAAVKLSGPGPVLYRQPRVGQGGRPFLLLKFRSMRPAPPGRPSPPAAIPGHPVGAVLRRTSLDELPQLWHVCGAR
jgi:hypothetical protein